MLKTHSLKSYKTKFLTIGIFLFSIFLRILFYICCYYLKSQEYWNTAFYSKKEDTVSFLPLSLSLMFWLRRDSFAQIKEELFRSKIITTAYFTHFKYPTQYLSKHTQQDEFFYFITQSKNSPILLWIIAKCQSQEWINENHIFFLITLAVDILGAFFLLRVVNKIKSFIQSAKHFNFNMKRKSDLLQPAQLTLTQAKESTETNLALNVKDNAVTKNVFILLYLLNPIAVIFFSFFFLLDQQKKKK
jgi:hypothetical protein